MILLTDKQIDFIELDIRSKGISMESLQHDLLDHICCILEREWDGTGSFESVYENVIVRFYKNELKEVEQETILLLQYKNYYKMKKTMMKSGMIAAILIVLGSFFKYMFWNGASVLLLSGVLLFAFVFLPLVCILQTRELKTSREKLTLVLGTAIGVLYSLSMTFQAMH